MAKLHSDFGAERFDLSHFLVLGRDAERMLTPLLSTLQLSMATTTRQRLRCLVQFGEALRAVGCHALPCTDDGWQALVLDVHRFVHTRQDRKQNLVTRHIFIWKITRRWFTTLVEEGLAPATVHIPPTHTDLIGGDEADRLIGDSTPVRVDTTAETSKLLMPISLSRSDAAYLDEVRDTLVARRQALFSCLQDYWHKLRENLEFGLMLRSALTDDEFNKLTINGPLGRQCREPPCNSIESLAAYLTVLHKNHGAPFRHRGIEGLTQKQLKANSLPRLENWPIFPALPPHIEDKSVKAGYILTWTWLGRLSQRDVSVIIALLTMLHAKWTPTALYDALVHDQDGKTYLDLDEDGFCFEIKKHRAKAMKRESLCPLAEEILTTVLTFSSEIRDELRSAGSPLAGRLFLPWGNGAVDGKACAPAGIGSLVKFLSGRKLNKNHAAKWLGDFYPTLAAAGLTPGSVSFKKIRATEGVLEWFRTKNLQAVSKRMGNSTRVVLEHYIPKALLHAWMNRAARRFQNLWIAVAAAEESFLLEVTDFSSIAELNSFIADLLQTHSAKSSPLATELHKRFKTADENDAIARDGDLHVSLNVASLSALYSYQAAALAAAAPMDVLTKVDVASGASPRAFMQLADLLQLQLPSDRNAEYRRIHEVAMVKAQEPALIHAWASLFQ
ncbi:MAG: hypothetical protein EON58_01785 [Alphaproteobacteria bacterium]|nr:MAG: hypothetical protein EON58_01785 [Alphaproteobacteria bacterium]